jgi:hypothetical protein
MVELQIVILAVAGSSPVGHPARPRWHIRCLSSVMLNPAVLVSSKTKIAGTNFWFQLLRNEELQNCDDLQKLVIGCEIIAAVDAVDLIAA